MFDNAAHVEPVVNGTENLSDTSFFQSSFHMNPATIGWLFSEGKTRWANTCWPSETNFRLDILYVCLQPQKPLTDPAKERSDSQIHFANFYSKDGQLLAPVPSSASIEIGVAMATT
jgi:hypothetical protein